MKLERLRERFFEGVPRYRWLETIGRGGMGIVFKAHDLDLDEVVAIKVLSPDLDADVQAARELGAIATPRQLPPLPVQGIPGWDAANAESAYYANQEVFRPPR